MKFASDQLTRIRSINPIAVDAIIALAFTTLILSWPEYVPTSGEQFRPMDALGTVLILFNTLPYLTRRAFPLISLAIALIAFSIQNILGYAAIEAQGLALIILLGSATYHTNYLRSAIAVGLTAATLAVFYSLAVRGYTAGDMVSTSMSFGIAWIVGTLLRDRRGQLAEVEVRALELEHDQEQATLKAISDERNRMAREMHDSVTQELYAINMYAEAAVRKLASRNVEEASADLQTLQVTAQNALSEMRLLIYELQPPVLESEGLAVAIQARLEAVEQRTGVHTAFCVKGNEQVPLAIQEELYGIAREALNNALKYAKASKLSVTLDTGSDLISMEVADDGVGFEESKLNSGGGMGLGGMRYRAQSLGAKLDIVSKPGEGTSIMVELKR